MSATDTGSKMLEQVFHDIRGAAEANLKFQQEAVRQWTSLWPSPGPQAAWVDSIRTFQKKWSTTVTELAQKHREVIDKQYDSALQSLEAALNVSEASTPEEYRRRSEEVCRKTLDCMRDLTESQMREFQEAVAKWSELMSKSGA